MGKYFDILFYLLNELSMYSMFVIHMNPQRIHLRPLNGHSPILILKHIDLYELDCEKLPAGFQLKAQLQI